MIQQCTIPTAPPGRPHTLGELFSTYQAEYLSGRAPSTQYAHRVFFAQTLREVGDKPLGDITAETMRAWKTQLLSTRKHGTAHKYLSRLSTVFNVAVEEYQWLAESPLKRVRKPAPSRGRVRFLAGDEYVRLLQACRQSRNRFLYPLVLLALSTGARKNELLGLQWSAIDLTQGRVTLWGSKTYRHRTVPVTGEALQLLRELEAARQPAVQWVFPNPDGTRPRRIATAWHKSIQRAGMQDFHFHDLRHTCASWLAMSGASLRDIAEILGHSTIQQTMLYAHLTQGHTDKVVERMTQQFLNNPAQQGA